MTLFSSTKFYHPNPTHTKKTSCITDEWEIGEKGEEDENEEDENEEEEGKEEGDEWERENEEKKMEG